MSRGSETSDSGFSFDWMALSSSYCGLVMGLGVPAP